MKKEIELPPTAFSNRIHDLGIEIDWYNWRQTNEWKMYVAGWNACTESVNAAIKAKYNMGETAERVFEGKV
jgi:hypothetical protein